MGDTVGKFECETNGVEKREDGEDCEEVHFGRSTGSRNGE